MAINDNHRDDDPQRDPHLARLLAAAGGEEPPAALDAAILAAARREVNARPQVAGGSGLSTPVVRAKRNWYVPVSIAAVLVLSVSLVTLVHQEKGDELAQPPRSAGVPAPAPATAPAAEAPAVAAPAEKADTTLRDAAPAQPKVVEPKRADAAKTVDATAATETSGELARQRRAEKAESAADGAAVLSGAARKDQPVGAVREQEPVREAVPARKAAPGAAFGGFAAGTQPSAPVARERQPEPFPAVREREAPAPASRDAMESRTRNETDRATRGAMQEAPVGPAPPPAPVTAAPRRAAPAEDVLTQPAPSQAEGRVLATPPPPPAAKPVAAPPARAAARLMEKRAPAWRGLEEQPPEKWLERLAEFRRDNRQADADELLAEFRRRFPDHPASAR